MKKAFLFSTMLSAGIAGAVLVAPTPALAHDCLLDRDRDGNVDAGSTDNAGGADSDDFDSNLACGVNANTSGATNATALGSNTGATVGFTGEF